MGAKWQLKNIRGLNMAAHRDFGYFFSVLIIIYCVSGLALNHINEWNPDFIISKDSIPIGKHMTSSHGISHQTIDSLGKLIGEEKYKVYDAPTKDQIKVYYDNASLHINFTRHIGLYEKVSRRPVIYHSNVIHRNSVKGWKWASDIFAVMLIVINVTGLFILKGKYGISGRGKWLIAAGCLPPLVVFIIHALS